MAFKKLSHMPDGAPGETYINPDHVAEVAIGETSWGGLEATVKYLGGAETKFRGEAVKELVATVLSPHASQSRVIDGRIEEG